MTRQPVIRSEGQRRRELSPAEVEIFAEHAEEAAFLWALRDAATADPLYDLEDLCALDERVEAHLDGLRFAGDAGWQAARAGLEVPDAGAIFTATVLAMERGDWRGVGRVLDVAAEKPSLARGFAAALGWVPFDLLRRVLPGLLDPRGPPYLRWLGIAGCTVHRKDPVPSLEQAVISLDPRLTRRAMVSAGELGREDLLPRLRAAFVAEDRALRFSAAWAGALLGDGSAQRELVEVAGDGGAYAEEAARMAARTMATEEGRSFLRSLAPRRAALAGAGALGDPATVPWILDQMADPELTRLAGGALTMMTGVDLRASKLAGTAPPGYLAVPSEGPEDEDVATDPDEHLPWPEKDAVAAWWGRQKGVFPEGKRYLLGRPVDPRWLGKVLRWGSQPARAAAAVELCLSGERRVVFEVRARGAWQRRALGAEEPSP